ncbi:MAG: epoxyqueuosine reductase [Thermodesulfobacteriota bacterium]
MITSETVKGLASKLGADLCGVASVERFGSAPRGFHPGEVYPDCRSVIAVAARFPSGTLTAGTNSPYTFVRNMMVAELDRITFEMARALEADGVAAVPIPSAEPYDYWDEERWHGRGVLSLKHAGQLAGLGRIGRNTLLVNDRFGNMIWLGAVLVPVALAPDPPAAYEPCPDKCTLCLDHCPQQALDGTTIDQKKCRARSTSSTPGGGWVLSCNDCRKICPQRHGLNKKKK